MIIYKNKDILVLHEGKFQMHAPLENMKSCVF